MPQINI